ncbi:hypothetical protein Ddc_20503 [Ditylenchus destructor]|nr:hypothetical protein Ddc_20503 [Ditylenchus destructor]
MMPVLIDATEGLAGAAGVPFSMWESNSICRYLAHREGRIDLLPDEPHRRALVEMWMDWQGGELKQQLALRVHGAGAQERAASGRRADRGRRRGLESPHGDAGRTAGRVGRALRAGRALHAGGRGAGLGDASLACRAHRARRAAAGRGLLPAPAGAPGFHPARA